MNTDDTDDTDKEDHMGGDTSTKRLVLISYQCESVVSTFFRQSPAGKMAAKEAGLVSLSSSVLIFREHTGNHASPAAFPWSPATATP
jgi:hypothetical protein